MFGLDKFVMALLFLGIMLSVALVIIAETEDQIVDIQDINESDSGSMTHAYNATVELEEGFDNIPGWVPLLVVVTMAAIVVAVVRTGFGGGRG